MKKNSLLKFFSDLRVYYVVALGIIFIWVPIQGPPHWDSLFNANFEGYNWIWNTDARYPVHYVFLALEFIFITVIFILFKKN